MVQCHLLYHRDILYLLYVVVAMHMLDIVEPKQQVDIGPSHANQFKHKK